jgi:putative membrane protein
MLKFNKIIKSMVLLMYIIIIFYTVSSGFIIKFIHPRTIPYTIICGIILVIFLLLDIFNKGKSKDKLENKNQKQKFLKSDIIYIIPLILVFFLNNGVLSNNQINNKNTNISKTVKKENTEENTEENIQENIQENKTQTDVKDVLKITSQDKKIKENEESKTEIIKITDSNFMDTLIDIFDNINDYIEKEIDIDGLVFRDSQMKNDEFAIGRPVITCCAADAQLSGYLCKNPTDTILKDNEWINIKATIKSSKYQGESIPYLIIKEVKSISKPKNEYVY